MSRTTLVRHIMTRRVVTVAPDANVHSAIDRLNKHGISGMPVVDELGKLVGILSGRDCMRAVVNEAYEGVPAGLVRDYMRRRPLVTLDEDAPMLEAAETFYALPYRRLPIVDKRGVLVGVLSRRDVLVAFAANRKLVARPAGRPSA